MILRCESFLTAKNAQEIVHKVVKGADKETISRHQHALRVHGYMLALYRN